MIGGVGFWVPCGLRCVRVSLPFLFLSCYADGEGSGRAVGFGGFGCLLCGTLDLYLFWVYWVS